MSLCRLVTFHSARSAGRTWARAGTAAMGESFRHAPYVTAIFFLIIEPTLHHFLHRHLARPCPGNVCTSSRRRLGCTVAFTRRGGATASPATLLGMRGKWLPHRRDGHVGERIRREVFGQALIGNVEAPAARPRQLPVQGRCGEGEGPLTHRQSCGCSAEFGCPVLPGRPFRCDYHWEVRYPPQEVQR